MWLWFEVAAAQDPAPDPPPLEDPQELPARITGTVIEQGSGLPLAGATITAGDLTVAADEKGAFVLVVPAGTVTLTFTAEDHKDATFEEHLSEGEIVEVKYRLERFSWSEEVVVYGEAREEIARQVISIDELRRVPGSFGDPIRALQSLPSVARGPELSGDIVARGAEARNTAAYINHIRIPFVFHFLVGRSVVDPGQLEDIEFYPGAVPPEYGDVSQAVINARTRFDRAEPGLHGHVHFDFLELGMSAATNLGDHWTLRVGGRRAWLGSIINGGAWAVREVRGLNDPSYRPPTLHVPYRDLQLRLVGTHGPDRTSFTLLSARDGIEFVPEWTDLDGDGKADRPEPSPLPFDPNLLLDTRFVRAQMRWDRDLPAHRYSTWITVGRDNQQNLVDGLGLYGATGLQFATLEQGWFSVGHSNEHDLSERFELKTGAEVVYQPGSLTSVYELLGQGTSTGSTGSTPGAEGPTTADLTTSAERLWAGPYGELVYKTGEWRFAPGVRVSFHHLFDKLTVVPEPRLGVRRALDKHWTILGYSGLLSQGPTLETAGTGKATGELSVLRAWQNTVGLEARWPSGLGLDVAVFETEMYDLAVRRIGRVVEPVVNTTATGGGDPFSQQATVQRVPYYQSVHGRAFGLEGQLRIMPRGEQFGWLAGSIGRSLRYPEEGESFRSQADIPVNLVAVWGTGLGKNWTISGRGQIGSGLVFTPLVGMYNAQYDYWSSFEGDLNSDRYPLYKRFDLRIDKTWIGRRARQTLYLDIYNALNQRNPIFAAYDWDYQNLVIEAFVPILPALGLEIEYLIPITLVLSGCGYYPAEAFDYRIDRTLIPGIRLSPLGGPSETPRTYDALILSPYDLVETYAEICGFRADLPIQIGTDCFAEPSLVTRVADGLPGSFTMPPLDFTCELPDSGYGYSDYGSDYGSHYTTESGGTGPLFPYYCQSVLPLRLVARSEEDVGYSYVELGLDAPRSAAAADPTTAHAALELASGTAAGGQEVTVRFSFDEAYVGGNTYVPVRWFVDDGELLGTGRTGFTGLADGRYFAENTLRIPEGYRGRLRVAAILSTETQVWEVLRLEVQ